ncbi:MAG: 50S ribosomal protein L7/L12 [Rickettsia sp.]|nr:50S ribosomal protein L7/L12 [Rickettsia sp.]
MSTKKNLDIKQLVNDLSSLTILEASSLSKLLEEEWGISASNMVAAAPVAVGGDAQTQEVVTEKTEFDVKMISFGEKKLEVIRTIRSVLGLGLKESKEFVEKAPIEIKKSVAKGEAEDIKTKLENAGAQIEIL